METRKRWIDSACSCAILQEKKGDRARGFWQRARKSELTGGFGHRQACPFLSLRPLAEIRQRVLCDNDTQADTDAHAIR